MDEMHYGVVRIQGRWTIIGPDLQYGSFDSRHQAEVAARSLAEHSSGVPVRLHVQDENGRLRHAGRIN